VENIFISMIGMEERVLGSFQEGNITADKYILFINKEFEENKYIETYKTEIIEKHLVGLDYKILNASYYDPFIMIKEFNKLKIEEGIDLQQDKIKATLDISTFNRQNLLVMLRLLRKILNIHEIEIIYTIPEEINQEISRGSSGFSNVPFFGGRFSVEKEKLLILLLGYEIDRPLLLWRELEPSRTILAEGFEPTVQSFYQGNKKAVDELCKYGHTEIVKISANDPYKAKDQLSELFRNHLDKYNIFVSPLNTKLQALGLYLAWEVNPDIQIVIAFPDKFSDWLSKGIKEVRRYKIL